MPPLHIRTYVFALLLPFGIAAAMFWGLALYVERIDGDLTRIGRWSENDFGWNAPQPVLSVLNNGREIKDPGIVVLGDSFSLANYWQSVLSSKLQEKILTFVYDDAGCVDNWTRWARDSSTAKVVIIQVVERNFVATFGKTGPCKTATPKPIEVTAGKTATRRATWPPTLDAKYLFVSAFNTLRMFTNKRGTMKHGAAINSPIRTNCAKFSSRQSNRLLHFSRDAKKHSWTTQDIAGAIANVRRLQDDLERVGKRLILVVAPDKSSVYQECLLERDSAERPNITRQLILAKIDAPDLLMSLKKNINTVVDLYHPNNTHWSARGYILVASLIEAHIRP
jgi:hypothetical protein